MIKQKLLNFLIFIRIVDEHDSLISLSALAMYVVLVKLAMSQQASLTDCGSLLLAFSQLSFKKYLNKDAALASLNKLNSAVNTVTQLGAEIVEKQKDLNV